MNAAPGSRTRLGALLLRKGLVTPVELEGALEAQRTKGGLLGEILVRSGLASRPAIEDALAEQVGGQIEAEAGFGTGLRSQIASRRPRRAVPNARPAAATAIHAVAAAPAPRPLLEAVPAPPEPDPVVRPLQREPQDVPEAPELARELMQQVARWQRLADELRDERDTVQQQLATTERARREAEERAAGLEELQRSLEDERALRDRVESALAELHAEFDARSGELREAREELEAARSAPAPVPATEHVVFVRAGTRYELVARDGPPPQAGDRLELGTSDAPYLVLKVGSSPLPGDDRPCAFAELA